MEKRNSSDKMSDKRKSNGEFARKNEEGRGRTSSQMNHDQREQKEHNDEHRHSHVTEWENHHNDR